MIDPDGTDHLPKETEPPTLQSVDEIREELRDESNDMPPEISDILKLHNAKRADYDAKLNI